MHDGGSGLRLGDGLLGLWPVGWGLAVCLWLGPPWFGFWFSFALAYSRISHECSSLVIIVINLVFMFSLLCVDWVGGLYAGQVFVCFCVESSVGAQGEVGWLWGCFGPPVVYSTDRSKAVVPVLVLLLVALWFILRGDLLYFSFTVCFFIT